MKESLLKDVIDGKYETKSPTFEHKYSSNRWKTILAMAKMYKEQKELIITHRGSDLMRLEIVIPLYSVHPFSITLNGVDSTDINA